MVVLSQALNVYNDKNYKVIVMLYLIGSLLLALGITVFIVSKIAELMHAKKPDMERVLIASLIGSIAAFITLVALSALVKDLDQNILLGVSVFSMLLVSSLAFKVINQMSWAGAITTNIANVALVLITGTAAIVLNGGSIGDYIKVAQNAFSTNTAVVENFAAGNTDAMGVIEDAQKEKMMAEEAAMKAEEAAAAEDFEPTFREKDFLPAATVKEMEAKKKIVRKAPRFYSISVGDARSAIGKNVRIKNAKGNIILGLLKSINGNGLVIEQRVSGGVAEASISTSSIDTLEVYR